jgi:genome maintenance exonuclease 1
MDQMMQLVPIRKKYVYPKLVRIDSEQGRTYTLEGQPAVPSVTTILSGTKDKSHLDAWAARVGQDEAEKIRNDAANVGTHMHSVVERLLLNRPLETPRTWLAVKGYWMGYKLIETFMPHVNEVWGTEIPLYYPEKYAGTSDCIGVYKDHSAIIDFKQTNKMKQRKWIEDYFVQLAAYALVTCGREFDNYKDMWMRRVESFLKNSPEA